MTGRDESFTTCLQVNHYGISKLARVHSVVEAHLSSSVMSCHDAEAL